MCVYVQVYVQVYMCVFVFLCVCVCVDSHQPNKFFVIVCQCSRVLQSMVAHTMTTSALQIQGILWTYKDLQNLWGQIHSLGVAHTPRGDAR